MKKIFAIPLSMLSLALILTGCTNNETTAQVGKNLDKNLNKLTKIVNKLDTIDNNYIANPDITINDKTSNLNTNNTNTYRLAFNPSTISTNNLQDMVKEMLYNKLSEQLTENSNGDCRICNQDYTCNTHGFCNNCSNKIVCDNSGNCTNCGTRLELTNSNSCQNCNNSAVLNESSCNKALNRINTLPNSELSIGKLSAKDVINSAKENNDITTHNPFKAIQLSEYTNNNQASTENNESNNNVTQGNNNELSSTPQNKIYVRRIMAQGYIPTRLRYQPRYYQNIDELDISDQIDNYIYKVQKLYAMTSDALEANSVLNECKTTLLDTVFEVKELNKNIIDGTCTPSNQQIQALKNYIEDIKTTITKMKDCNGDLNNQINKISSSTNSSIATSVDVMNSNYLSLLNHLDTRITYHESAIATLEQIKYLIEDAVANNEISIEELEEYNNQLSGIEESVENEEDTNNNDTTTTENVEDNVSTDTNDENNTNNEVDSNTETNVDNTNDNQNIDASTTPDTDQSNDTATSDVIENETSNGITPNIDTYKPVEDTSSTTKTQENTAESNEYNVNDNVASNNVDNSNNNITTNTDVNNNDNDSNINNSADNTTNSTTNNTNNTTANNTALNSNNFTNGIITQNNLDNSGRNGGYYYGNDGKIHNNGTDNGTTGNNGNTIENNLNRNNNVNTYGYNTMLDIINQGTVNNGINTL